MNAFPFPPQFRVELKKKKKKNENIINNYLSNIFFSIYIYS